MEEEKRRNPKKEHKIGLYEFPRPLYYRNGGMFMSRRSIEVLAKRAGIAMMCLALIFSCFGCSSSSGDGDSQSSDNVQNDSQYSNTQPPKGEDKSTPTNDTAVGLKNIKIDSATAELTDEQKAVIEYFDEDYLSLTDYEFMRRYPNLFQGAQVTVYGAVIKVLRWIATPMSLLFGQM